MYKHYVNLRILVVDYKCASMCLRGRCPSGIVDEIPRVYRPDFGRRLMDSTEKKCP